MMKRRYFMGSLAAASLAGCRLVSAHPNLQSASPAQEPAALQTIEVGSSKQLFLDDSFFAQQKGLRLTPHPPSLSETAIKCERPWEKKLLHYSSVLHDGNRYRMWYGVYDGDPRKEDESDVNWTCYAESRDGIHWEKPNLGLVSWKGQSGTNIVFPTDDLQASNASVILDPNAPASERYKMVVKKRGRPQTIHGYYSADGLRWSPVETNPFVAEGPVDSHNILIWDDERRRYVLYLRGVDTSVPGSFIKGRRAIRRTESVDFRNWSPPELVVTADQKDPVDLHFYTNAAWKYDRAARAYLMFPMILYPERVFPGAPLPGTSDIQFATSRDGIKWERRFRQPFIKPGLDERNWVDRNPIMGQGILHTGPGEMSLYYSEFYRSPDVRLRRCKLRTDGFVSVESPYQGWGEFTTQPLKFTGRRLEMNYSTSGGGSIQVELQDEAGNPLPGYASGDCKEIFGDKIDGVVQWKKGDDIRALKRNIVRLHVRLRDAHLFAFHFRD